MRRRVFILAMWAQLLTCVAAGEARACLWDYDTVRDEQRGLPGIAEVLAGRVERHSRFFYEQRAARMEALVATDPKNLAAWDNLAVAYEKLGDHDRAIATILRRDAIAPGQYTTYANLGTFYLHKGSLDDGIAAIRKALAINPDAHFGREEYQLKLAEFYAAARADPSLLKRMNFLEWSGAMHPSTRPASDPNDVEDPDEQVQSRSVSLWRGNPDALRNAGLKDNVFDGIVGMLRFGPGDTPELYLTLGDLLALRGSKNLAIRAYLRAIELNHPRAAYARKAADQLREQIYHPEQVDPATIAAERADAQRWVAAYQTYEDDLVRRGINTENPANYAAFYAKFGPEAPRPSRLLTVRDWVAAHSLAIVPTTFAVVAISAFITRDAWRRRRAARGV